MKKDGNESHPEDDEIQQPINRSPFEFRLARILHELRVAAGEDDDAVAPLRVAKDATPQQDFFVVQRILLALPRQSALEFVQVVIGRFANDLSVETAYPRLILAHLGRFHQALAAFQIGLPTDIKWQCVILFSKRKRKQIINNLPVQLSRFNVTEAVGLGRGQKKKISRDELIVFHANDVAHLHFVPTLFHRLAVEQDVRLSIVHLRVAAMSLLNVLQKEGGVKKTTPVRMETTQKTGGTYEIIVGVFDGR